MFYLDRATRRLAVFDGSGIFDALQDNIALKTALKCGCVQPYTNGLMAGVATKRAKTQGTILSLSGVTMTTANGVTRTMWTQTMMKRLLVISIWSLRIRAQLCSVWSRAKFGCRDGGGSRCAASESFDVPPS